MIRFSRTLLASLLVCVAVSGCAGVRGNGNRNQIAGQLEEGFKERWVSQRVGELLQSGQAADGIQARRMAMQEFADRYEYVRGVDRR